MSDIKVEVAKGEIFEIKPDKRYLIIFNREHISPDDAARLNVGMGDGISVLVRGNPKDVKIIEDNRKATEEKDAA